MADTTGLVLTPEVKFLPSQTRPRAGGVAATSAISTSRFVFDVQAWYSVLRAK